MFKKYPYPYLISNSKTPTYISPVLTKEKCIILESLRIILGSKCEILKNHEAQTKKYDSYKKESVYRYHTDFKQINSLET